LSLLFDIVARPALVNGRFNEEYLAQEKENLKIRIEGRVNDKMQYSVDRCLEEVCRNEPYEIYDYGFVEDLEGITAEELTEHYRNMIGNCPMQVYLAGSIGDEETERVAELLSGIERTGSTTLRNGFVKKEKTGTRHVTETMNVTQGKLCLGCRTNTPPDSDDYPALMVCNGILGGGIHSKLFRNVREKAGLAYYAYSMLEKFKGLMIISSGIDIGNKQKALDIIEQQLDDMAKGNISDQEMDAAVKSIETGIKSLTDSQINVVDFYLSQTIAGTSDDFTTIIEKVKKVTKDDVTSAARRIVQDTVYFLTADDSAARGR
jgi:predicted Zn-dependent peptidase